MCAVYVGSVVVIASAKTGLRCMDAWSVCRPHQGRIIDPLCPTDITTRYVTSRKECKVMCFD